ncbi:hypothetical protein CBL_00523 [Carabus blaptoides fortunei]
MVVVDTCPFISAGDAGRIPERFWLYMVVPFVWQTVPKDALDYTVKEINIKEIFVLYAFHPPIYPCVSGTFAHSNKLRARTEALEDGDEEVGKTTSTKERFFSSLTAFSSGTFRLVRCQLQPNINFIFST